eukprot:CAMPEP_0182428140 /NCGR_PEP_ID=MMETSP1167-20130531/21054_1 /TAXON_ID=2988 /ORGANISM="Mallomonas Sp, Strain CCMP3275" /LENGTH=241 /DNA_ID=CAMNT_0024610839 /DNA_START=109 /DNA_END=835 /DNA_ORIENTATION=+
MSLNQVYIGNLDVDASVNDLHKDFDRYGRIRDIWVARKPPGFAFIEYEDERDASDAVQDMNGRWILDKRIRVEISRRGRPGERRNDVPRAPPRRTDYRVRVSGLSGSVGWRDLKDMLREVADPAFVDVFGNGDGIAEFFAESDVDRVIRKLDDTRFMGNYIRIVKKELGENGIGNMTVEEEEGETMGEIKREIIVQEAAQDLTLDLVLVIDPTNAENVLQICQRCDMMKLYPNQHFKPSPW